MPTRRIHGIELAYADRGAGLPVVLLHGFPLDHTMWAAQLDALAGACRVIALDLCGFGQSGVRDGTATMEQMADDAAGLLDALGIGSAAICGLSMGGYVALAFWRRHAARTAAFVLCDTRAAADAPAIAAARRETAEQVLREGPAALAAAMTPRLFSPQTAAARPEVVAAVQAMMLRSDRRGVAAAARGMAERPDSTPLLPQIGCPTLLLVGADDAISPPAEMRGMAAAIGGSELVEIPAAGHMSPMENPAAVNAALAAFLARVATATGKATGS